VRVQAYRLTARPILDALARAARRGVDVAVIVDREEAAGPLARALEPSGGLLLVDAEHPIAHDKVVVVDGASVETGSFNYTHQAESNAENCVVLRDAASASAFAAHWDAHRAHALPLAPRPR
jgi:phosphatidylserine/phosphatidylglycerophosphate/cardiolipin synthase-like enzyme